MYLKGKEVELPEGRHFKDKDGHRRHQMRIKWWLNPVNQSFKSRSVIEEIEIGDHSYQTDDLGCYHEDEKPVFFRHYWLQENLITTETTYAVLIIVMQRMDT